MNIQNIEIFKPLKLKPKKYPKTLSCIIRIRMIYNDNKKIIDQFCKNNNLNVEYTLNKFIKNCNEKDKQNEQLEKQKEELEKKKEKQKIISQQIKKNLEKLQDLPTIRESIRESIKKYIRPSMTERYSKRKKS
jgi:1-aminocyclopropane-1-carboxylate deaminase/D-cysteine desulfhydrase-like pyridoxal-dependent ACC family enzyme